MEVQVSQIDSKEIFYVDFDGVEYFAGPMVWQGANFRLGQPQECIALIRKLGRYDDIPEDYLLQNFQLFTVVTTNTLNELRIEVIARRGTVSRKSLLRFQIIPHEPSS